MDDKQNPRRIAANMKVLCARPADHGVPPEKLASRDEPSVYCPKCLWDEMTSGDAA